MTTNYTHALIHIQGKTENAPTEQIEMKTFRYLKGENQYTHKLDIRTVGPFERVATQEGWIYELFGNGWPVRDVVDWFKRLPWQEGYSMAVLSVSTEYGEQLFVTVVGGQISEHRIIGL